MKRLAKEVLAGATAGIIAAYVMRQFVLSWHSLTHGRVEDGVFGLDRQADVTAAKNFWQFLLKKDLAEPKALQVAAVMHYGFGAVTGAGYAVWASQERMIQSGYGTAFGAVLWLIGDEIAISVMGVSDPRSKTAASHAMALAAHLLFGYVTELSRLKLMSLGSSQSSS